MDEYTRYLFLHNENIIGENIIFIATSAKQFYKQKCQCKK